MPSAARSARESAAEPPTAVSPSARVQYAQSESTPQMRRRRRSRRRWEQLATSQAAAASRAAARPSARAPAAHPSERAARRADVRRACSELHKHEPPERRPGRARARRRLSATRCGPAALRTAHTSVGRRSGPSGGRWRAAARDSEESVVGVPSAVFRPPRSDNTELPARPLTRELEQLVLSIDRNTSRHIPPRNLVAWVISYATPPKA